MITEHFCCDVLLYINGSFSAHASIFSPPFSLPALSSSKVDEVVELFEESEVSTVLTYTCSSGTPLMWTPYRPCCMSRIQKQPYFGGFQYGASRHGKAYLYG